MKLKIFALIVLLSPVSLTHADATTPADTPTPVETPVAKDTDRVCENRINAYKSALQAVIDGKATDANQNVEEAKTQLAQINKLPSSLSPCEKQREIPAFQDNGAVNKQGQ